MVIIIIKSLSSDRKICKQTQPISMSHHSDTCEVKLYLNPSKLSRNCDLRISKFSGKLWHRLSESNSWLYVINSEEVLTISCKKAKEPFDVKIGGTGILTLHPSCKAFSSSASLMPKRMFSTSVNVHFIPEINFTFKESYDYLNLTEVNQSFVRTNFASQG